MRQLKLDFKVDNAKQTKTKKVIVKEQKRASRTGATLVVKTKVGQCTRVVQNNSGYNIEQPLYNLESEIQIWTAYEFTVQPSTKKPLPLLFDPEDFRKVVAKGDLKFERPSADLL